MSGGALGTIGTAVIIFHYCPRIAGIVGELAEIARLEIGINNVRYFFQSDVVTIVVSSPCKRGFVSGEGACINIQFSRNWAIFQSGEGYHAAFLTIAISTTGAFYLGHV